MGEAFLHLNGAYAAGLRSVYIFEALYRFYQNAPQIPPGESLLPVLRYAAARGADIYKIITKSSEALSAVMVKNPQGGEALYHLSKQPLLLKDICTRRMREKDDSPEAFALYQAAERTQIFVPGLYARLVQTAFKNNAPRVNPYTLQQFLQTHEPEGDLAVYVYHLLLTDPHLSETLPTYTHKILQLAARALEQKKEGRQANSLYYFYWARNRAMGITDALLSAAEEIIKTHLTHYELTPAPQTQTRFIYITDPAKRGMDVYELP